MWRLGRGLALVATGRLPGAEGEHVVLAGLTKQIRRDRTTEEKTERALLKIAERVLAGELAARRQRYDDAIRLFEDAIKMEEALPYSEPPLWPLSVRHHLGDGALAGRSPVRSGSRLSRRPSATSGQRVGADRIDPEPSVPAERRRGGCGRGSFQGGLGPCRLHSGCFSNVKREHPNRHRPRREV